MLLNHYSMQQLLEADKLSPEQVSKIAYHMTCKVEKVPMMLSGLKDAVDEMEVYLAKVRKYQQEQAVLREQELRA